MTDRAEHLTPEQSSRGFAHFPAIPHYEGYEFEGEFLDFDTVKPRNVGEVRVYESSDAVIPAVWLQIATQDPINSQDDVDEVVGLTVENARKLGEQLIALADNHYQTEKS